jgi:acetyl-CoA synthetase
MTRISAKHSYPLGQKIVWEPSAGQIRNSNLMTFAAACGFNSYADVYDWSVSDIEAYWQAVLTDLAIPWRRIYRQLLDLSRGKAFPRWAVGAEMNIYDACISRHLEKGYGNEIALHYISEDDAEYRLSYSGIDEQVRRLATGLQRSGIKAGDVVALYMPMNPDLLIAFFAILFVGAIILPLFSGYGHTAIRTRLINSNAKAIIYSRFGQRRGKRIAMEKEVAQAITNLPALDLLIHTGEDPVNLPGRQAASRAFTELLSEPPAPGPARAMASDAVAMLIYTSGTTGNPKGAVHTHLGFPIKAAHDLKYNFDLGAAERLFWYTDIGWMMGPWEIFGALINRATMIFFDGVPDYPNRQRLWQIVSRAKVTHLGISPTLIRSLMHADEKPARLFDLSHLRLVGSTGSPWDPESWRWLFTEVLEKKKAIINYSGGTEISGGILCGNLLTAMKPGSFSGPMPGMDIAIVDEKGQAISNAVGELVIKQPWIGMTQSFWQDDERYLDSYWRTFPGLWRHGDFAVRDSDGLYFILGRSDDTIKVAGKRIGPAEVEAILNRFPQVKESAAIAIPDAEKDNVIVCYVVADCPASEREQLRKELHLAVATQLGKALKPAQILFSQQLAKTRNAKIMRRVIRAVHLGIDPGDLSSLEDTSAIEAIRQAL